MKNTFIRRIWEEKVFLVRDSIWKMPTDMVSFAVSTGLGVSVVAGIISGVCYVLAHGSQRRSNRKSRNNLHCDVCGEYFRSIDHILGGDSSVTCLKCQKKVCQKRCATFCDQQNGWTCKNCLRPPESWFKGILYAIQPNKKGENMDPSEDKNFDDIQQSREQVQDFMEKLINSMLGQNVDDANVTKMYNDEYYEKFFEVYHRDLSYALTELGTSLHSSIIHLPLTGQQSPCTAHAALKQLIEKILQEVINLPQLQQSRQSAAIPPDLNDKTYEDLLATAILNKVISTSQNDRPSSTAASVSSRMSNSSHIKEDKEYFFGEETLDSKWRNPDMDTTSVSSLEDWLQSDCSFGSKKYVDRVTLTIKQDIEELSQASESDNEDDADDDSEYFRAKSSLWSDDEPNWFLQKRTFQGTHSPVPVPMLVPNPTTETKVLIGDKEVDETSDLSDVGSEYGETEIVPTSHGLLIDSKTVIGGKNPLQNGVGGGESESESSADSGVKEVDRGQSVYESDFTDRVDGASQTDGFEQPPIFISRADITVDDDNVEDASILSVYSNTEQEAEYTERYASLPRTIEKNPSPQPRILNQKLKPKVIHNESQPKEKPESKGEEEEVKMVQMHFSGSYSRREKEKWKNAIEMKNNPYSKENMERRIKRSNSAVGSIFGPDYYAKLASSPSGTKARSPENRTSRKKREEGKFAWPPQTSESEYIVTNDTISSIQKYTNETTPEKHISKTYISKEENQDIFKAIPVIIEPEVESLTLATNHTTPKSSQNQSEMTSLTSDSDLSYVHVYNVENAKISKQTKTDNNEPKSEPEGKKPSKPEPFKFVKSTNVSGRKFVSNQPLKRHKSETDLLDDFYNPPKILGKKRDNTLISKIYLDPQVRSFALSSRPQLPVNNSIPTFRTQLSHPEMIFEQKAYNSDDGLSAGRNKKYSIYSSEEDLLSSNSLEVKNGTMTHTAKMSLSSEDDHLSERSSIYIAEQRTRPIYSSSEDLLSIDEMESPRKRDNTLISKIYQQPTVRNYALANRYNKSVQDLKKNGRSTSSEDELFSDTSRVSKVGYTKDTSDVEEQLEIMDIKEKINYENENENEEENDLGVEAIAKRKIVHNILGKFSAPQPIVDKWESREELNMDENITISVKDLKKKFEKSQAKSNVVSSLTARSLSKQMKEYLRK